MNRALGDVNRPMRTTAVAGVPGLDLNPVALRVGEDLNLRDRLLVLAALLDLDEHFGPVPGRTSTPPSNV